MKKSTPRGSRASRRRPCAPACGALWLAVPAASFQMASRALFEGYFELLLLIFLFVWFFYSACCQTCCLISIRQQEASFGLSTHASPDTILQSAQYSPEIIQQCMVKSTVRSRSGEGVHVPFALGRSRTSSHSRWSHGIAGKIFSVRSENSQGDLDVKRIIESCCFEGRSCFELPPLPLLN